LSFLKLDLLNQVAVRHEVVDDIKPAAEKMQECVAETVPLEIRKDCCHCRTEPAEIETATAVIV
jgi:hypothetical protein